MPPIYETRSDSDDGRCRRARRSGRRPADVRLSLGGGARNQPAENRIPGLENRPQDRRADSGEGRAGAARRRFTSRPGFPENHLQERLYSFIPLIAKFGPDLAERLYDHVTSNAPTTSSQSWRRQLCESGSLFAPLSHPLRNAASRGRLPPSHCRSRRLRTLRGQIPRRRTRPPRSRGRTRLRRNRPRAGPPRP